MSNGVQFDIDNEPRAVVQTKTPAMVRLVIKFSGGLIKNDTQANYALLVFAILIFALSIFIFSQNVGNPKPSQAVPVTVPTIATPGL